MKTKLLHWAGLLIALIPGVVIEVESQSVWRHGVWFSIVAALAVRLPALLAPAPVPMFPDEPVTARERKP